MKFCDIAFRPEILQALAEMGFEDLSPIQEQTLLAIVDKRDIVAIAETGSGKTSACAIPLTHLIDDELAFVQVLVMVPTRELALQYVDEIYSIARYTKVSAAAVYGGSSRSMQRQQIKQGAHILVATPGRLIDLLHTGEFDFRHLRTLVLDEADEMLDMGFVEDVEFIMSCIMQEHQTLLFSATMPKVLDSLIHRFLKDPVRIELTTKEKAPSTLEHEFRYVPRSSDRLKILTDFLTDQAAYRQALIFCNSRFKGEHLYKSLRKEIPKCEYLHGGMDQDKRSRIFAKFKKGSLPILIATDVAGRGLDFSNVSHVVNFDFPRDVVSYTHRTGRAGRMGRKGLAMSYVTDHDISVCYRIIEQNNINARWIGDAPSPSAGKKSSQRPRSRRR